MIRNRVVTVQRMKQLANGLHGTSVTVHPLLLGAHLGPPRTRIDPDNGLRNASIAGTVSTDEFDPFESLERL